MNLNDEIVTQCGVCAAVVYHTLQTLGGKAHMRVMELRRHMPMSFGESTIKKGIKALIEMGYIKRDGEMHDARGFAYKVIK